ncbi:MAG: helix-turn-helix transcriptional regulator [Micropepsaceae bacterium]|jgi:transcriptional regulator with XRE-family HTH domain
MSEEEVAKERAEALGAYLKSQRLGASLTLRDVEEATEKSVSNAYLSQLENGKIHKPSPNVLHALSMVYQIPYAKLMERAGYVSPAATRKDSEKHGQAATFAIENLSKEEESELLKFLSYVRSKKGKP